MFTIDSRSIINITHTHHSSSSLIKLLFPIPFMKFICIVKIRFIHSYNIPFNPVDPSVHNKYIHVFALSLQQQHFVVCFRPKVIILLCSLNHFRTSGSGYKHTVGWSVRFYFFFYQLQNQKTIFYTA